MTIVIEFLTVNYLSTFNGVLGRPLLKAMKVVTSIHCLTMKFPTLVRTSQVRGRQWDFRECYNKSLELAEKREGLSHTTEVEKTSKGPMETNVDPYSQ